MREAIIELTDAELAALGFGDLVRVCREAGVRDVELLEDRGTTCLPQIEVESRLDEARLDELECVDRWERVAEKGETYCYLLELTATGLTEHAREDHDELIGTCEPTVREWGLLVSLVGPQAAIGDVLRHYEAAGVSPDLRKLGAYEGGDHPLSALTDRQLEVVETAYEMGFYEVPRETSTADVASELGLDTATVSEHLQRAERNLLPRELSG